jgi:SAM-dependent methyltransferase
VSIASAVRAGASRALRRASGPEATRHSLLEPGNLLVIQERERHLARVLCDLGYQSFEGARVIEAGCAGGYNLRQAVQWGARPDDVVGIDLDEEAVGYCRERMPAARVHCGSAEAIPEPDRSFDIALAFTLFSSVPEEGTAAAIGAELLRVLRPRGVVLVYDMRRRNPLNPAVHPISATDIRRWFPGCTLAARSLTLAPPIARPIGRYAPWLYRALAALPFLRSHSLFTVRPATRPAEIRHPGP